jgi:hypothetical protein
MTYDEKRNLYESVMKDVAKIVKHHLNENLTKNEQLIDLFNKLDISDEDEDWEVLEKITKNTRPQVYEESQVWSALDAYEEYEDVFGDWDDTVRTVSSECDRTVVAGYSSQNSFKDCLKSTPEIVQFIVKNYSHKTIYVRKNWKVIMWTVEIKGYEIKKIKVLRFNTIINNNGYEHPEYNYLLSIS